MAKIESKFLDKRTVDRYLAKGQLTAQDLEAHLKGLPDEEGNAEVVQMELYDAEMSDSSLSDEDS